MQLQATLLTTLLAPALVASAVTGRFPFTAKSCATENSEKLGNGVECNPGESYRCCVLPDESYNAFMDPAQCTYPTQGDFQEREPCNGGTGFTYCCQ
ncbi:hypothetical protein IAQ61_007908 [Plenodomus lingam]|uniref:Predicted protein n=1 Tax=Leptosphaeria maculans (strain JN3 / isolate v23.1.3 / race Av1-4-5-6-7-8) TaxID=985895 RepID=E4ZZP3_LEPMJ|nr:predicted protein [Plenodomus lingam JN3]KAH9867316.1 hypothetical protein IAQ61_007908 [Plenodomus lingam]CBX97159.1 predicted protein [Plenodomus lingam JN3]